jgi:hypothetical protein
MNETSVAIKDSDVLQMENDTTLGEICNTLRVVWGDAKRVAEGVVNSRQLVTYKVETFFRASGIRLNARLNPATPIRVPPFGMSFQRLKSPQPDNCSASGKRSR